jgi:hypothetical protein
MKRKLTCMTLIAAAWTVFAAVGSAQTTITLPSTSPTTITFIASNPDTPTVSGSPAATVSFLTSGGSNGSTWNVQVQATTANFGSCPSAVPASQVRATCTSATVSGGAGSGTCAGAFNLSTALQTVASGTESPGNNRTYTVTLSFTFTDSWSFIPASCTLGLSYFITAN